MNKILKYKWIIISLLIIILILFFGEKVLNSSSNQSSTSLTTSGSEETVKKGTVTKSISATGTIETANYLAITTSVNGIVKEVYVKEGDKVKKGQKIMDITLDSEGEKSLQSANSSYLRAQISLSEAQNSLNQLSSALIQKETAFNTIKKTTSYQNETERSQYKIAENDYIKAKNDYDLQKSSIAQQQIALSAAYYDYQAQSPTIIAPDDGVIFNVVAVAGSKIENSVTTDRSVKTVASIKKEGTPIASVNITEMDIANVKVGQKVNLALSSLEGQKFTGTVAGIDKVGTISSGVSNYPVIVKFEKDSESILPNMSVSCEIIIEEKKDILYVPNNAITTNNGKSYVTVIKNNEQSTQEVTTGFVGNDSTEILTGLNENETVLIGSLPTSGFTTTTSSTTRRSTAPGVLGIFGGR